MIPVWHESESRNIERWGRRRPGRVLGLPGFQSIAMDLILLSLDPSWRRLAWSAKGPRVRSVSAGS